MCLEINLQLLSVFIYLEKVQFEVISQQFIILYNKFAALNDVRVYTLISLTLKPSLLPLTVLFSMFVSQHKVPAVVINAYGLQ